MEKSPSEKDALKLEEEKLNSSITTFTMTFSMSMEVEEKKKNKSKGDRLTFFLEKIIYEKFSSTMYQATIRETGETVAIKKVRIVKDYKNRELEIVKMLNHPNIISCRQSFYTKEEEEVRVYLVMDYMPETLQKLLNFYSKTEQIFPPILIKLFSYQIFKALSFLQTFQICHRDLKPKNILFDPSNFQVKLCDFGNAKILVKGERNSAKVYSKFYRAPELFSDSQYHLSIDVWATGCIIGEMTLGRKAFNEAKEQGTEKAFKNKLEGLLADLLAKILKVRPADRLTPIQALAHDYFNEIREEKLFYKFTNIDKNDLFYFNESHKAIITSLQFIYSRNQLLSASEDGELRLWNIETLKCLQILREHKKGIIAIIDIPKFRIFITGSKDRSIRFWSYHSLKIICIKHIPSYHDGIILDLTFSDSISTLFSTGKDKMLKANACFHDDFFSMNSIKSFQNNCSIFCLELIKDSLLAGGTNDSSVILFEPKNLKIIRRLQTFKKPIYCLLWEKNRDVLIGGQDNKIIIWNYKNGQVIRILTGHRRALMKLIFFEDKNFLGGFGYDNKLSIWDIDKALNVKSFLQTDFKRNSIFAMTYHYYASILYLPEKKKFVSCYFNDVIKIRDSVLLCDETGVDYLVKNIN